MQKSTCTECLAKKSTFGGTFRGPDRDWVCAECSDSSAKLRTVEKYFAKRVGALGGDFRHVKWPGRKGGATHAVVLSNRLALVWVGEPEHRGDLVRMQLAGVQCSVVKTTAEVDTVVEGWR